MDILKWISDQIDKPVKMIMFRFNFDKWTCRHCEGTGVCRNGFQKENSCKTCIQEYDENENSSLVTVRCSVCGGNGREREYLIKQNQKLKSEEKKKNEKFKTMYNIGYK